MLGPRKLLVLCAGVVVGCGASPSRLDPLKSTSSGGADPWSIGTTATSGAGSASSAGSDDSGPLGGFDLQGTLAKVKENIEKPGPYEAPEKSADFDAARPYFGVMELGGAIVERTAYALRGGGGIELRQLVARLRALAKDPKLTGLLLRVEPVEISMPDLVELRVAFQEFRNAKKPLLCHTEDASNATYLLMTACDRIGIAPLGQVAITGPAAMPIHIKPVLDRFGITADFLHVGAYKGAAEPLTREAPSKEMEETLGAILDLRYQTMVTMIHTARTLAPQTVKDLIDTGLFASEAARAAKLVDEVTSFEAFRDITVKGAWNTLELEAKDESTQLATMVKLMRFIGAVPPERPAGPHVAVVYAIGDIVDGSGDGVIGARQQIASHTLVATLRALTNDDAVKSVVLRIDSGGGSAQASELIWRAVTDLRAKKPVIVSMSDVAASGGYYIAAGATKIYALEETLTGSIGVVGGRIAIGQALAQLGVKAYPMGRGKHATMMTSLRSWTDDEKAVIQRSMEEVYKVFLGRVAEGRKKQFAEVEQLAQGRVWTGKKALELGLIDAVGGIDLALAEARTLGNVDATTELEVYPSQPTLRDFLVGYGAVHAPGGLAALLGAQPETFATSVIGRFDPVLAAEAHRLFELVLAFRTAQIQTVSIVPVLR